MGRKSQVRIAGESVLEETIKSIIIGMMIHNGRMEKNWTMNTLADESDVSKSYISNIERGGIEKIDSKKLANVARALDIDINEILNLNLSDIQQEEEYSTILQTFNTLDFLFLGALKLNPQDVASMIRASSDYGTTLAEAIKELFVSRGITEQNIIEAIIRASQKETQVFNEEREEDADRFREEVHFPRYLDNLGEMQGYFVRESQSDVLSQILVDKYNYHIDTTTIKALGKEELPDTSWIFVHGDHSRKPHLFIHSDLSAPRKAFLLCREIYFCQNNIKERPWYTRQIHRSSHSLDPKAYEQRWNFYQGSYFAGAVLLPRKQFGDRLKAFFESPTWDEKEFIRCAMSTTPTTFFIRIGELMNELFEIDGYSYVRFDRYGEGDQRQYQISNSINTLADIDLNSYRDLEISAYGKYLHHCRRWLPIDVTEEFNKNQNTRDQFPVAAARRARYVSGPQLDVPQVEDGKHLELFVFSILSDLPIAGRYRVVSIAFECNDKFKNLVKFWNDGQCSHKYALEGHACELCNIEGCNQRANLRENELVDHWLWKEWKEKRNKKKKIEAFRNLVISGK